MRSCTALRLDRIKGTAYGREDDHIAGVVLLQPVPLLTRIEKRCGIREHGSGVISHDVFAVEKEVGIKRSVGGSPGCSHRAESVEPESWLGIGV